MAKHRSSLWRLRLSQVILALCVMLSFGGIYVAAHFTKCDADAGRGGAIAVGLALGVMFLDRSYASRLFYLIQEFGTDTAQPVGPVDDAAVRAIVREEISVTLNLLDADARRQKWQNFYLACGTFVGTLSSGFGDVIARIFIGHRCS